VIGAALLVGLVLVTVGSSQPRSRPPLIGTVILLTVIELALGLKAIEAFLSWRERPS